MRNPLLVLAVCSLSFPANAQVRNFCQTDEVHKRLVEQYPGILERDAQYEEDIRRLVRENAEMRDDHVLVTIPIVFHVLHLNGVENISNEQILNQLDVINEDFRALNPDIGQVIPEMQGRIGDTRVQFALPTRDPYGNCHNGIDRIRTVQTLVGENSSKTNIWRRDRYLNVWLARAMIGGAAGFATFPAGVAEGFGQVFDGVMMLQNYAGRIGTSNTGRSHILSHEIGHYLNLQHVWGSGAVGTVCGDDGVEDTPITTGYTSCPSSANARNCDPDSVENYQNHMDYSYCHRMFTKGQVERMRAALALTTADRSNLWAEETLAATGIAPGSEARCPPQADFYASVGPDNQNPSVPFSPTACTGTNVLFRDNSSRAFPTSWSWTFQDGNPATSDQRHPTVSFTSPGWKRVTLTVSNEHGATTKTDDYGFLVSDQNDAFRATYTETFDVYDGIWPFLGMNHDDNHTAWKKYTGPGADGGSCAWLNSGDRNRLNIINQSNAMDIDDLISPTFDLTQADRPVLSFRYSYSTKTTVLADVTERLEVYSSVDCGRTWQLRTPSSGITGAALITNGTAIGPGGWKTHSINLPGVVTSSPTVRFRFRYHSSANSGDLFIDDITVGGTVGITELDETGSMNLYPNPTNDRFSVQAQGMDRFPTEVIILDIRGAIVYRNVHAPSGAAGIEISSRELGLSQGIYTLRMANEAATGARKLVVGL